MNLKWAAIYNTWDWWTLFQCRYHWLLLCSKYMQQENIHLSEKYQNYKKISKRLAFHWFQQAMGNGLGDVIKHQNFTYGYFWEKSPSPTAENPRGSPRPEKDDSHKMGLERTSGHDPYCMKRHWNSLLSRVWKKINVFLAYFTESFQPHSILNIFLLKLIKVLNI